MYGSFSPNVAGASTALMLHHVALGWEDLYSYSGSGSNSFRDGVIGNSFILDTTPGTYSMIDAPLKPGDAWVYGPWYSPASGQNVSSAGIANGIMNTTSLLLIENLNHQGTAGTAAAALSVRTSMISAASGERPEGRGCAAAGCVAPAVPTQV
jgi:hypothetical protein